MNLLFKFTLSGRVGIKKNSQQRKYSFSRQRTITMPSDRYLTWESQAVFRLKHAWAGKSPIATPVMFKGSFYFKNHQNEPDLSNCYEGPQDALQKAGVILNDRLIYGHDGSRKLFLGIGAQDLVVIELFEFVS